MWGFHLIMSPLPMIAPKVKLSQGDTKQSKKQFACLTISSLLRGVVEDIYALEGVRSQPLPNVYCSEARIQRLWCFSSGLWWQLHLKVHGTAPQGKQDLDTLEGVAHDLWVCRLNLDNSIPCSDLPLPFPPILMKSLGEASFWWEHQALCTFWNNHWESEGRVYQTHMHPALSKYFSSLGKSWLSFTVFSRVKRNGADPLKLRVFYCFINLLHSRIISRACPQKQNLQLLPASVPGIFALKVVHLMSNGAEVKGKRLCSHAICSCKLGNRIARRSMGMDAEGKKNHSVAR